MVEASPIRLTLVSASPRRRELLTEAGWDFDVHPTAIMERWSGSDPLKLAAANAERKVRHSDWFGAPDRLLVGADTIVCLANQVFGKPAGRDSAGRMIRALSGRAHQVVTGVAVAGPSPEGDGAYACITEAAVSTVRFRELNTDDVRSYLDSKEWEGKAGAYAIQGLAAEFVEELSGDYQNVIGLPVSLLNELISRHFGHCRLQ